MNDLSLLSYIFQQSLTIESVSGIVFFCCNSYLFLPEVKICVMRKKMCGRRMKEMRHSSIQRRNFWCLAGGVTFKRMTSHWRRLGKRLFTCNVWTFAINCQHLSLDSLFWSLVHAENTNLLSRGKIPVWMVSSLTGLDATWQYNLLTIWGTFNFCNNIRYGGIFQPLSVKQQWIKA